MSCTSSPFGTFDVAEECDCACGGGVWSNGTCRLCVVTPPPLRILNTSGGRALGITTTTPSVVYFNPISSTNVNFMIDIKDTFTWFASNATYEVSSTRIEPVIRMGFRRVNDRVEMLVRAMIYRNPNYPNDPTPLSPSSGRLGTYQFWVEFAAPPSNECFDLAAVLTTGVQTNLCSGTTQPAAIVDGLRVVASRVGCFAHVTLDLLPAVCNVGGQLMPPAGECACPAGTTGVQCQYSDDMCNDNETVQFDGSCECTGVWSGPTCTDLCVEVEPLRITWEKSTSTLGTVRDNNASIVAFAPTTLDGYVPNSNSRVDLAVPRVWFVSDTTYHASNTVTRPSFMLGFHIEGNKMHMTVLGNIYRNTNYPDGNTQLGLLEQRFGYGEAVIAFDLPTNGCFNLSTALITGNPEQVPFTCSVASEVGTDDPRSSDPNLFLFNLTRVITPCTNWRRATLGLSPMTCLNRGTLRNGMCECNPGFAGPECEFSDAATCGGQGTALGDGSCECDAPWTGTTCSDVGSVSAVTVVDEWDVFQSPDAFLTTAVFELPVTYPTTTSLLTFVGLRGAADTTITRFLVSASASAGTFTVMPLTTTGGFVSQPTPTVFNTFFLPNATPTTPLRSSPVAGFEVLNAPAATTWPDVFARVMIVSDWNNGVATVEFEGADEYNIIIAPTTSASTQFTVLYVADSTIYVAAVDVTGMFLTTFSTSVTLAALFVRGTDTRAEAGDVLVAQPGVWSHQVEVPPTAWVGGRATFGLANALAYDLYIQPMRAVMAAGGPVAWGCSTTASGFAIEALDAQGNLVPTFKTSTLYFTVVFAPGR